MVNYLMKRSLNSKNMKNQQSTNNKINSAINDMLLHDLTFAVIYAIACVTIHLKSRVLGVKTLLFSCIKHI